MIAVNAAGTRGWTANIVENTVLVADVAIHTLAGAIELPAPRGVVIAPDSRTAYVTLAGGELAAVDLMIMTELRRFAVQASPDGVAVDWRQPAGVAMAAPSRFLRPLSLAVLLAFAGCDDEDGGTGPGDDVYGVWQEQSGFEDILLDIQTEQVVVYEANQLLDCHDVFAYVILDREGEVFTLQQGDEEVLTTIRREGDGLVIETDGEGSTYDWVGTEVPASVTEC